MEIQNSTPFAILLPTKKIINEALCAMQLFRMLGFSAEEIFMVFGSPVDKQDVSVLLKQPDRTFIIQIGITTEDPEVFTEKWTRAAEGWNTMQNDDAMGLFKESDVRKNAVNIMGMMLAKGFKFNILTDAPEATA